MVEVGNLFFHLLLQGQVEEEITSVRIGQECLGAGADMDR